MSTDTTDTERRELLTFLQGKTIAGLRFDALPGGAFDIIFTDHSELELYNIAGRFTWGRESAIYALKLQIHRLPQPWSVPLLAAYGGCKSWVNLDVEVPTDGSLPVVP